MGIGGFASSVRNERAAGREREAAQSAFAWGERGDAAVKQGGIGGVARLRTRGRGPAWGIFRAERADHAARASARSAALTPERRWAASTMVAGVGAGVVGAGVGAQVPAAF